MGWGTILLRAGTSEEAGDDAAADVVSGKAVLAGECGLTLQLID